MSPTHFDNCTYIINGTIYSNQPVNSNIITTNDIVTLHTPPNVDAAPIMAYTPGSIPVGQKNITCVFIYFNHIPNILPIHAPTNNDGTNKPAGIPVPNVNIVCNILNNDANNNYITIHKFTVFSPSSVHKPKSSLIPCKSLHDENNLCITSLL